MSAKVQALVWDYYSPEAGGAPIVLAVALADEADDLGGGISQSNDALAKKTRQTERAVRQQLRRMEDSKVLICEERSAGGAGKYSRYRIDLTALIVPKNPEAGAGLTRNGVPGSDLQNPASGSGFSGPLYKGSKDLLLSDGGTGNRDLAEDERLARWMFSKLQALNPKHREPSWSAWKRDIKAMRERDKRKHREIAELFEWANRDPFWQVNILSPGKLRQKWDQLQLKRRQTGGALLPDQVEDRQCIGEIEGVRCAQPGAFKGGDQRWRCRRCRDLHQEAA